MNFSDDIRVFSPVECLESYLKLGFLRRQDLSVVVTIMFL